MGKKNKLMAAVVIALLLEAGGQAMAEPALDFTGGTAFLTNETIGLRFTVTAPNTISGLGVFDVGADGLAGSHELALWTIGGTPLASATITTANSLPVASTSPLGDWRFTSIASLTLAPGDYVVGGQFGGPSAATGPDRVVGVNSPFISTIAGVTFDALREGAGPFSFAMIETATDHAFFGPNLFAGSLPLAAPEPATMLLLGSGLIGLWGARRKLKK